MTYHDNEVQVVRNGFSLFKDANGSYGHFEITDYSVSDGQDPNGNITKGKILNVSEKGIMCLKLGRHKTKKVAEWWKQNVPYDCNTFNEDPKELNFAVRGTLVLNIDSPVIGGKKVVTYSDICMGQGNTLSRNNWWFGGAKNCYYKHMYNDDYDGSRQDAVMCFGHYVDNGVPMMVRTLVDRSELGVSVNTYTFYLKSTENLSCASWMSKLPDGTCIKDVVMPASHDAGMSELRHTDIISSCSMGSVKTQKNSIYEQMMCGVRYFDLRVDYDHSELVTYHRTKFMGANGQSFRMVFMQAQDFLREHDKEIIIFRISHFRNYNEHKPAETLKKLLDFLKKYSDTGLIYKSANPKKLHEINLGEARGKIILAVQIDDNSVPNAPNGIFKYSDAGDGKVNSIGENTLNVYDRYSNSSKYETMQKDQFEKWKNNGGQGDTKLFLLSWTLTLDTAEVIGGAFDSKYTNETLAKKANPKLAGMLAEGINTNKYAKPNMVYLDYIDSALCKEIISYNFK